MFGLFKKKKYNSVVKLFKVVDLETASGFDNRTFISGLLKFIDDLKIGSPTNYDLMGPYPKEGWTTKNGFLRALERKEFRDVIYLYIGNENFSVKFSNWLPNYTTPPPKGVIDFDIEVASEIVSINNLTNALKLLTNKLEFDYGYGFVSDKLLGLSESNAKVRWYGISSKTDPNEMKWAKESIKVEEGKIKNLFNMNFLSKKYHKKIIESISSLKPGSIEPFDNKLDLWTIDSEELEKYQKDFADFIILTKSQSLADTST